MKKKRICLTLSESDGIKLDEIASELKQTRTAAMRVVIAAWKSQQVEELKQQVSRLNNLVVVFTVLLSGFIKETKGSDVFFRLKNEADQALKTYKETGKLTI